MHKYGSFLCGAGGPGNPCYGVQVGNCKFRTLKVRILKMLILWYCVKVKQCYPIVLKYLKMFKSCLLIDLNLSKNLSIYFCTTSTLKRAWCRNIFRCTTTFSTAVHPLGLFLTCSSSLVPNLFALDRPTHLCDDNAPSNVSRQTFSTTRQLSFGY